MIFIIIIVIVVPAMLSGCASYPRDIFWENKIKPTSYETASSHVNPERWHDSAITYAWLGHATVLINLNGTWILTDPVLFDRIGPPEIFDNLFGIKRLVQLPIAIEDIPEIDLLTISHPHFDHLDLASLNSLREKYENRSHDYRLIVPALNAELLDEDFPNVLELDWFDRTDRSTRYKNVTITAFRVEHYGFSDWGERNVKRGFNGYLISSDNKHIAFFGDTSYLRFRDETGELLKKPVSIDWRDKFPSELLQAGIDLCIIPIGDSTYYWNHIGPDNAIRLAQELNCKKMLPIHYGTFLLTPPEDEIIQPRKQLLKTLYQMDHLQLIKCQSMQGDAYGETEYPDIGVSCVLP